MNFKSITEKRKQPIDFKQHPKYPNIVCSSDGRVFLERKGWAKGGGDGKTYRGIDWWSGGKWGSGKRIIKYVHRLVAEAFGKSIEGLEVHHQDDDPSHNSNDNLEPMTGTDNRSMRKKPGAEDAEDNDFIE